MHFPRAGVVEQFGRKRYFGPRNGFSGQRLLLGDPGTGRDGSFSGLRSRNFFSDFGSGARKTSRPDQQNSPRQTRKSFLREITTEENKRSSCPACPLGSFIRTSNTSSMAPTTQPPAESLPSSPSPSKTVMEISARTSKQPVSMGGFGNSIFTRISMSRNSVSTTSGPCLISSRRRMVSASPSKRSRYCSFQHREHDQILFSKFLVLFL